MAPQTKALRRSGELNITANYFLRDRSEPLFIPDHTFLIEKKLPDGSIYRVVWDLGLRPEFKKESYVFLFKLFNSVCRANVPQLLEEGAGIDPHSINAAVISHMHFDHLGDISAFPSSTELILGPKATTNIKEQADLLDVDEADLRARKVRVLSKETDTWTNVGPFEAIDYFKDGSFFILSSPGVGPFQLL
jgi:glyoxylase-like metal-dependent hydrolase (beta-lactamase superfamily II)